MRSVPANFSLSNPCVKVNYDYSSPREDLGKNDTASEPVSFLFLTIFLDRNIPYQVYLFQQRTALQGKTKNHS